MDNLYHYTTPYRARKIYETQDLRDSVDETTDAKYGPGKYLTDLPPETTDGALMRTLWQCSLSSPQGQDRQKDLRGWVRFKINRRSLIEPRMQVYLFPTGYTGRVEILEWGTR